MCLYLICRNPKLLTESKNVIFLSLFLFLPCLWQATFISCYQENAIWSNLGANCSHLPNLIMCFVNQALRRSTRRWQMMSNIWLEKRLLYKLGDSGPESRWPIGILQYFEPLLTENSDMSESEDHFLLLILFAAIVALWECLNPPLPKNERKQSTALYQILSTVAAVNTKSYIVKPAFALPPKEIHWTHSYSDVFFPFVEDQSPFCR